MPMIPVLKPKLVSTPALIPYLEQIDEQRWYSNFGSMVQSFEQRLQEFFANPETNITMLANGTLGLTIALQALDIPRNSLCLMPSWTFTATPAAALAAGLTPIFMDVDQATQIISPERVKSLLPTIKEPIGAVIPVSAFGAPIDVAGWDAFTQETGIPVVIDAAAAFDAFATGQMTSGKTPVMISMHATKIFGIGEGGVLLTNDADLAHRFRKLINFGFELDRLSHRIAMNAKPSEYHAAIGMATLDQWNQIKDSWHQVQATYMELLSPHQIACWMNKTYATTTCNILLPHQAISMAQHLKQYDIDTRRWWETGCHMHPAYQHLPLAESLHHTEYLGASMLGLPSAPDLSRETIEQICQHISTAVAPPISNRITKMIY